MSRQSLTAVRSQAGFTLVELAVVMIIIGLLIGGVLKGQELVKNAQIASTIAQVKGLDAATSSFKDMYNALPGDIAAAQARLPNCNGNALCTNGNGDGVLNSAPGAAPGGEASAYFIHLALADLLTGIDVNAANCNSWGNCFPEAKAGAGAGFQIGYNNAAALGQNTAAARGNYLTIQGAANGAFVNGSQALTPNQAARIDTKIDDGNATTGSVFPNDAACHTTGTYNEATTQAVCDVFIRIQG